MQNPFRHHDEPHRPDRGRDEGRWDARDLRPDEYRTWGGGDGGRSAEAFRREEQAYGRDSSGPAGAWTQDSYQQNQYGQGASGGWSGESGGYAGPSGYATGASSYGGGPRYGQDHGRQNYGQSYGSGSRGASGQYGSQMNQDYGGHHYGQNQGQGHASHGYAPGSQIWEGSGRNMGGQSHEHHDFEPDYLHWRQQQLSAFDKDYSDWRNERREKFSSDFDSWRQSRPRVQAENPIVGDVADGGTGDASEAKKR
ncbi:hypothetical protein N0B44_29855 [Roseibacterium beibuensis]|uniref:hypothetical protein n=1 Tax=[Roseibacterium] beibuensis TaxID=1193142 RepID=UPI00217D4051|nr:hypothetical protein [Roseibacterium beibuensis]MCS6627126.1 hypothetical protein [Roseibacterium beibuensis]